MTITYRLSYGYSIVQIGQGNQTVGNILSNTGTQTVTDATLTSADLATLAGNAGADMAAWLQNNFAPQTAGDNSQD